MIQLNRSMENEHSVIDTIRKDDSDAAGHRRQIAALAALGLFDFSLISLFQLGYIKELPDPPGGVFDSAKVNSSEDAVLFGIPDGPISLMSYAATMLLATAATRSREHSKIFDLALAGILLGQAAGAAHYMYKMAFVQKKICMYCVAGAVINFAALVPLARLLKR
jgi:uncharacterized membrane protein